MVQFDYLNKGLWGLARAHRAGNMAGHLGAALAAGYFFGEDHHGLDRRVHQAVEKELDRILRGEESIWFNPQKAGVTVAELFEPFPRQPSRKDAIATIARALAGNLDKTRQSGHNVIFAALAVRALHDHPDRATPPVVDGIRKLIEGFDGAVPGRGYYGKKRGWIGGDRAPLAPEDRPGLYEGVQEMAEVVVGELIEKASVHRRGFGGLFHVINHAAGLAELWQYGYKDLARKGLAAHRHHVRLWRALPDLEEELGPVEPARHDPRTPAYWTTGTLRRDSARLTHRVKTLYGFFTLLRHVKDSATRKKAEERFLYLMG